MKVSIEELKSAGWTIVEIVDANECIWKRDNWLIRYDILNEETIDIYSEIFIPINLN